MTEIAKRALVKEELVIAENYLSKAIRTSMLDKSYKRSPEPYLYLAEVQAKKAKDEKLELSQRHRFFLQAAALHNFVRNYLNTVEVDAEVSRKQSNIVSSMLHDIQDSMISSCGGNPLQNGFDTESKKTELKNLRNEVKESLESLECNKDKQRVNECEARRMFNSQTEEIKRLSDKISVRMKQFLASIINECLELLGTPPCDYEVIVLGSLARNEMTPYSDFEWAILTSSEEEECKVFFRNLTNLVHLQVREL